MARSNRLLINEIDSCVDEMLEGIVDGHPGQSLLEGHRVVVRKDVEDVCKEGKVTIVCGGGSGHEPFAAGYVGRGMLTAAVAGSVFASPPPKDILAAIRAIASPGGTLVIVANYTGDRLNFGIAIERASALGIKVGMVTIGEDCALQSSDKTAGRRGLCGIVSIMKIAGAMSEMGKSLEEIVKVCENAAKNMGTIGVSVSAASVPGSGPSFDLPDTEMEVGLGAHGEAGVRRMKLLPADQTVEVLIDHMTDKSSPTHLTISAGESLSVMMNNLGGLSELEMHILARKTIVYIESKGAKVSRFLFGHFMTSIDMSGFNMNILKLDEELTTYIDAETHAPAWPNVRGERERQTKPKMKLRDASLTVNSNNKSFKDGQTIKDDVHLPIKNAIERACNSLISSEAYLNDLDSGAGDGDCGATLKRGANSILSGLPNLKAKSVRSLLQYIANCAENSMGGASGGIYSLLFTAASNNLSGSSDLKSWCKALEAGIKAVSSYGGADPGDRTMLDALVAIQKSLNSSISTGVDVKQALSLAAESASIAVEATTKMQARAGRASYVSADQLTKPDAGAAGVAVWMQAIANF